MDSEYNYINIANGIICHIDRFEQVYKVKYKDTNRTETFYKQINNNIFESNNGFRIRCYMIIEPLDLSKIKVG